MRKQSVMAAILWLPFSCALAGGWTPPMTISSAFTEDSDLLVVYTTDSTPYTSGCSGGSWIVNTTTETRRARAWATILTAIAGGHKVSFWYGDSCTTWGYLSVTSVKIIPQ